MTRAEILRGIIYDEDDVTGELSPKEFTLEEKKLALEFKKTFEVWATVQVTYFINLLSHYGTNDKIDIDSIRYYTFQLLNGPHRGLVMELVGDKHPFFRIRSDSEGATGEFPHRTNNNTSIAGGDLEQLINYTTFTKLPGFSLSAIELSLVKTESVFRDNFIPIYYTDNTLPIKDKKSLTRISEEPSGGYDYKPIANYIIKDCTHWYFVMDKIRLPINAIIRGVGGMHVNSDEKMFMLDKHVNPFITNSISENYKILRYDDEFAGKPEPFYVDLNGEPFTQHPKITIRLNTEESFKDYEITSSRGQLSD